jgi:glycosyltransferase involved in cell wall biosynthesis
LIKELVLGYNIPVIKIDNGVDIEKFYFTSKINRPLKICTLGNLIPRKRVLDLVVNNPDLKIDIGGKGKEFRVIELAIKSLHSKFFSFSSNIYF